MIHVMRVNRRQERENDMATERLTHDDWMDTLTPEEEARVARALADSAAGRVLTHVSTEALARFCALDDTDARRLLDNVDELRVWFAAHA